MTAGPNACPSVVLIALWASMSFVLARAMAHNAEALIEQGMGRRSIDPRPRKVGKLP